MAKNVNEVAIKSRQTKLQKKTSEDLINIILKKDNVERNLNNQIVNLKKEVNILSDRIKGYLADINGQTKVTEKLNKEIESLHDVIKAKIEQIDSLRVTAKDFEDNYNNAVKYNVELTTMLNSYKKLTIVTVIGFVITLVGWISVCF